MACWRFFAAVLSAHGLAAKGAVGANEAGGVVTAKVARNRAVASLRREVHWLRAELDELRRQDSESDGRVLVLTLCAGTTYFDVHCGPLLASFERAYGRDAARHRVVAFSTSVEPRLLQVARERFSPWAHFETFATKENQFPLHDEDGAEGHYRLKCEKSEGEQNCSIYGDMDTRNLRTGSNVLAKFRVAGQYLRGRHAQGFAFAVVMDSDALFVQPVGAHLAASQVGGTWDVAFTAYDEDFTVPWADDAAGVGRTKRGFARVNAGVTFFRLDDLRLASRFLYKWSHVSELLLSGGYGDEFPDHEMWERWQDELVDDFRGSDPAALALLLSSFDTARLPGLLGWGSCSACSRAVEVDVSLFTKEPPMLVRLRGLPARTLNHAESMENGTFPPDLALVHLKGTWWRTVLSNGVLFEDATRRPAWNRDALALYRRCLYEWQLALPSELRAGVSVASISADCSGNN